MNLRELQQAAHEEQQRIEQHYRLNDKTLLVLAHMTKITEEVGELGEEVLAQLGLQRKEKLAKRRAGNLEKEFADVIYATAILADALGIDMDAIMTKQVKAIKERGDKEYKEQ